jgi:hypothetical protein
MAVVAGRTAPRQGIQQYTRQAWEKAAAPWCRSTERSKGRWLQGIVAQETTPAKGNKV